MQTILVKWLSWSKPEQHDYKPNVDGSRKGAASTDGGVVRIRWGEFVCGFSALYEFDDIVEAELKALYDGLELCRAQGLDNICIESDAALVVKLINESF